MIANFYRFSIKMTLAQALSASGPGRADEAVAELQRVPAIKRQLAKLKLADVREELHAYGAWTDEELNIHSDNLARIVWIAAGDIVEDTRRG